MTGNAFLDTLNHRDRVRRARTTIELALSLASRPVVSTKFGPHSAVLLRLVSELSPKIPVVWVDTGYNTRATREFVAEVRERLDIDLRVYTPLDHVIRTPPALDEPEHSQFVETVKLVPFRRALSAVGADAWITSVRREQSDHRSALETFTSGMPGVVKIAPLLDWQESDMLRYAHEHELPIGPECYDPTKGEPMRECGLHTRLSA